MSASGLFKIKHFSGRILGPLDLARIRKLILKNQITGTELARAHPNGEWRDINSFPPIADLLLQHAEGKLKAATPTLSSLQSSYRPILGETVVLPVPEEAVELESPGVVPPPMKHPHPAAAAKAEEDVSKTVRMEEVYESELDDPEDKTQMADLPAMRIELDDEEDEPIFEDAPKTVPPGPKSISQEATVMIQRVRFAGREWRKLNLRELLRVVLLAGALGYFGYDTFLKEEELPGQTSIFRKPKSFRAVLPETDPKQIDPATSQKYYLEAMKNYVLDHAAGYMAAAQLLHKSVSLDPENVKAIAMLASSYINLIDHSNKDDNYFGVIATLIDMAKAKAIDLPETIIAEVEFLNMTNRPAAALEILVNYTKKNPSFDRVLHYYAATSFFAKEDYKSAATQLSQIADNKAFSAKVFYLKGRTAEALGDPSQAKLEYEKALRVNSDHMLSLLREVAIASRESRTKETKKEIDRLIDKAKLLPPKQQAEAYFYQSKLYQLEENWEGATFALERSATLDPRNHAYLLEYYTLKASLGGKDSGAQKEAKMYYFLSEGEKLLNQGQYQEALTQFLQAKDSNPGSLIPYVRTGDMFSQLNDVGNARENYRRAAELAPNSISVWSKYIHTLIESYEWEEAQKGMDKFRSMPVGQSAIDKLAGDFYAKQNRHVEAQTYYKKAMLRDSIDPDVYIAFAKSLMAVKNFKSAPFFFALAQRFDPMSSEAVIGIARATSQTEGLDAGVRILQDELQKSGTPRAELLAGIAELLIQKGEWKGAQTYVNDARRANPDYAYPWKLQAQIYLNDEHSDKKALDKALDAFKSYSDRNTSDPSGYFERFQIYMRKAQFEQAGQELDRIFALYPKYPNLHYYKGVMYTRMSNHKVAVDEYKSEIQNNPNNVDALVALGKALTSMGDAKTAVTHLAKAMQLAPKNAAAKVEAAGANRALRNFNGAIALYQAAIQLDPGNPLIYRKIGDCYREMGDSNNARAAFKKYLQMEPDAVDRSEIEPYL